LRATSDIAGEWSSLMEEVTTSTNFICRIDSGKRRMDFLR
jgi:hypothetical protein